MIQAGGCIGALIHGLSQHHQIGIHLLIKRQQRLKLRQLSLLVNDLCLLLGCRIREFLQIGYIVLQCGDLTLQCVDLGLYLGQLVLYRGRGNFVDLRLQSGDLRLDLVDLILQVLLGGVVAHRL